MLATEIPEHLISRTDPYLVYDFEEQFAFGNFGTVCKAKHIKTHQIHAIKVVEFDQQDEGTLQNLIAEITVLSKCNSQHVTGFNGAWIFQNICYISMELVGGGCLTEIYQCWEESFDESQIAYITREVLKGLKYLHKNNIIHRDIKGENILMTEEGEIKIADFGTSVVLESKEEKRKTFTGTPFWMAPEVIANKSYGSPYDFSVDIWSLGITVLEIAQSNPPHADKHPMRVLLLVTKGQPPKLTEPQVWSESMSDFISVCLQKDASIRPTASELLKHPFVSNLDVGPDILLNVIERQREMEDESYEEPQNQFYGGEDLFWAKMAQNASKSDVSETPKKNDKLMQPENTPVIDINIKDKNFKNSVDVIKSEDEIRRHSTGESRSLKRSKVISEPRGLKKGVKKSSSSNCLTDFKEVRIDTLGVDRRSRSKSGSHSTRRKSDTLRKSNSDKSHKDSSSNRHSSSSRHHHRSSSREGTPEKLSSSSGHRHSRGTSRRHYTESARPTRQTSDVRLLFSSDNDEKSNQNKNSDIISDDNLLKIISETKVEKKVRRNSVGSLTMSREERLKLSIENDKTKAKKENIEIPKFNTNQKENIEIPKFNINQKENNEIPKFKTEKNKINTTQNKKENDITIVPLSRTRKRSNHVLVNNSNRRITGDQETWEINQKLLSEQLSQLRSLRKEQTKSEISLLKSHQIEIENNFKKQNEEEKTIKKQIKSQLNIIEKKSKEKFDKIQRKQDLQQNNCIKEYENKSEKYAKTANSEFKERNVNWKNTLNTLTKQYEKQMKIEKKLIKGDSEKEGDLKLELIQNIELLKLNQNSQYQQLQIDGFMNCFENQNTLLNDVLKSLRSFIPLNINEKQDQEKDFFNQKEAVQNNTQQKELIKEKYFKEYQCLKLQHFNQFHTLQMQNLIETQKFEIEQLKRRFEILTKEKKKIFENKKKSAYLARNIDYEPPPNSKNSNSNNTKKNQVAFLDQYNIFMIRKELDKEWTERQIEVEATIKLEKDVEQQELKDLHAETIMDLENQHVTKVPEFNEILELEYQSWLEKENEDKKQQEFTVLKHKLEFEKNQIEYSAQNTIQNLKNQRKMSEELLQDCKKKTMDFFTKYERKVNALQKNQKTLDQSWENQQNAVLQNSRQSFEERWNSKYTQHQTKWEKKITKQENKNDEKCKELHDLQVVWKLNGPKRISRSAELLGKTMKQNSSGNKLALVL